MLSQKKEYSRYYSGFRGVDFSTDDTLVHESRFPFAVNMYKDYVSGAGQGIETIPGFRERFKADGRIYGIHTYKDNTGIQKVLIHSGNKLYLWNDFGKVEFQEAKVPIFTAMNTRDSVSFIFNNRLYILDGVNYLYYDGTIHSVADSAYIPTTYINVRPSKDDGDIGMEYEQRNMLSPYFKHTFIADGETTVYKMNEENLESIEKVKCYGVDLDSSDYDADPTTGTITFKTAPGKPENNGLTAFEAGIEITAKKAVYAAKDVQITKADGTVTTFAAYPGLSNGETFRSMVESATIATLFDNRVFLSGIPGKPNLVLYCSLNDPSYIGILNYFEDGVGTTPITAMLSVANTLMVLKNDTQQDGSVYYHTAYETGENILPKIYPSQSGLAGVGCLGAACNFLDDPVFVSRLGLDAIGLLSSAHYERVREHRSSMVDPKLLNGTDLSQAKLCEYGGYLLLLVNGKIFMADSRQVYQNAAGNTEYEWYYLEDIGVYVGQTDNHKYIDHIPESINITYSGFVEKDGVVYQVQFAHDIPEEELPPFDNNTVVSQQDTEGESVTVAYVTLYSGKTVALLCDKDGSKVGGTFSPAVTIATITDSKGENLYFGTADGHVCSFNFDKRKAEDGTIDSKHYHFNGRAIFSGCALKNDNCGIPHMTKTTVKKSLVVKVKNFSALSAKIRVKTNKKSMTDIATIKSHKGLTGLFDYMDFSEFSFITEGESLFAVREKEKKWVEKQYFIYSDTFMKPFSLFYVAYKYTVQGNYKG